MFIDKKNVYNVAVRKTQGGWYEDRQIDQWNRIETLEIILNVYGGLTFNRTAQIIQWARTVFSISDTRTLG